MEVKKKSFALASKAKPVAAAVAMAAALMAPQAQAVNVSQNGLGEVLLFSYYTVNNGFDTNINITNTSENTVVFKIRFREALNSRDARDFNVILSPFDVWSGTVTASGSGALIKTNDQSCTAGQLQLQSDGSRGIAFTNFDYIDGNGIGPSDGGPTDLARGTEGHIEVIEMGHQKPLNPGAPSPDLVFTADSVGDNAQHVNGVPRDCDAVRAAFTAGQIAATQAAFFEPINVLQGSASLIKATEGKAISYEPTVLANFFNPDLLTAEDDQGALGQNLIVAPESQDPGLDQVNPPIGDVIDNVVGLPVTATFGVRPVDAVSAILSREVVTNRYSVNPANAAKTDWVVTMPTKYYYVDEREPEVLAASPDALPPFGDGTGTAADPTTTGDTFQANDDACASVAVEFRYFDREEAEQVSADEVGFSPAPPGVPGNTLCHETNVLSFAQSNVFGSANTSNVPVDTAGFNNGWMRLQFPEAGILTSDEGNVFLGLPVIGFAATTLENGTNAASVLNYGMGWSHGYVTNITVAAP